MTHPATRRIQIGLAIMLLAAVIFAAGWWAASVTLTKRVEADTPTSLQLATAQPGEVGRAYNFGLTITIPSAPVASNALAGVVTEVGDTAADQGSVLYVVGDQPVFAIQASKPFYRDLESSLRGDDVRALQQMLHDKQLLTAAPDGIFGPGTEKALRAYEKSLGLPETGRAPLGSLVAFSALPQSVSFEDNFRAGKVLSGGEEIVRAAIGDRIFKVGFNDKQQELLPLGAEVTFTYEGETFRAVVSDIETSTNEFSGSSLAAILTGVDGASVCDTRCDLLPDTANTSLIAEVRPEPAASGIVVPAAALRSGGGGDTYVVMEDGSKRTVDIIGSGQGMIVVTNVQAGEKVQLSARDAADRAPDHSPAPDESDDPDGAPPSEDDTNVER